MMNGNIQTKEEVFSITDDQPLSNQQRDEILIRKAQAEQASTTSPDENGLYNHEQLKEALFNLEEIMLRAMGKFVLLGKTAQKVYSDKPLIGDKIHAGMLRRHLTTQFKSILETLPIFVEDLQIDDDLIAFKSKGVPVHIEVIDDDKGFLQNPDYRFYDILNLPVPNPFDKYWLERESIHD